MDPLRLANIIKLSILSVNQIWEIAKEVKLEASLDLGCKTFGLYEDHEKRFQVEAFEKRTNVKSSEQAFTNITKEDITTGVELFLYINSCPATLKPWFVFYKELFQTQSPDQIMLTLNRMMKDESNIFFKSMAQRLFKKTSTTFSLHYEEIKSMFHGGSQDTPLLQGLNYNKQ